MDFYSCDNYVLGSLRVRLGFGWSGVSVRIHRVGMGLGDNIEDTGRLTSEVHLDLSPPKHTPLSYKSQG